MNKLLLPLIFFLVSASVFSQIEKYPVFKNCDTIQITQLQSCFKSELKKAVLNEFITPENVLQDNYKGTVNIVFVVTSEGNFKLIYVNSPYNELKEEVERVFKTLPIIIPAKYNNHSVEMQFGYPLKIPLEANLEITPMETPAEVIVLESEGKTIDTLIKSLFPEHKSELNVPLVHSTYNSYEFYMNQGENTHTTMKPYV